MPNTSTLTIQPLEKTDPSGAQVKFIVTIHKTEGQSIFKPECYQFSLIGRELRNDTHYHSVGLFNAFCGFADVSKQREKAMMLCTYIINLYKDQLTEKKTVSIDSLLPYIPQWFYSVDCESQLRKLKEKNKQLEDRYNKLNDRANEIEEEEYDPEDENQPVHSSQKDLADGHCASVAREQSNVRARISGLEKLITFKKLLAESFQKPAASPQPKC